MFKKHISHQLLVGFIAIVLISMLAIGIFFIHMFRQYTIETHQKTLLTRAYTISEMLSENAEGNGFIRGYGGLVRFLDTMSEAKVWITNSVGNPSLMSGMGMGMGMGMGIGPGEAHYTNSEPLPNEAASVIQNVLTGKESVSESFSDIYNESTLTVGVPILNSNKEVLGAVLLHAPVTGITDTLNRAIRILGLSLLAALILATGLGIFYSIRFTRPLKTMNQTALEMTRGNYSVRTKINRMDEIGQLGNSLDQLATALGHTINELYRMEQFRKEFVANVSHEFRTPLTVIKGSLEAIVDGTVDQPEEIKRYHERMLSETRSLERLVGDLLELSRLQSGKISIYKEEIHISSLIADAVKSLQTLANRKGIRINFTPDSSLPPVLGDYDRLRQLLVIFLDNAIKYSPEDTVISVELNAREQQLEIEIHDQGYGISPAELPYVWHRFYKVDKSRRGTGTGLGLSIARHLIELHSGQVSLESELGKGTSVKVILPLSSVHK